MLLSIVFSFRNEAEVIPELIKRLRATLDPLDLEYELLFVNDASSDNSLELLLTYREQDQRIKIINMSRRFGIAPCLFAGFRHAKGDAVVYLDADLQDPPELIPVLLERWRAGAEVVHTTRTARKGENALKMWLTRLAYRIINVVADIDIPENTGDYKLLSRRAANELVRLNEHDPFMRGLVRWVGFEQAFVYYERDSRFAGQTHFPLFKSTGPTREFMRGLISFSSIPLYFALFIGAAVALGAFVYLMWIVFSRVVLGMHLPGWPAMMVTMLFLGGTILFTIGVLGVYIGRIYEQIKQRPQYIIQNTIGIEPDAGDG